MILVEETQIADTALPVDGLKRHLRFGTGFAEDALQDDVLCSFLRAALAAIEARTSRALLVRGFVLTLNGWQDDRGQALPIAPVREISDVSVIDRFGASTTVDPARYRLQRDAVTPRLMPQGTSLAAVPHGGAVEIRFLAGFDSDFDLLPADLAQAVLLLAAHYYEYRDDTSLGQGCMPFGVTSLIARYRPVRVGLSG